MSESDKAETASGSTDDCSVTMARVNVLMLAFAVPLVAIFAFVFASCWGWVSLREGIDRFLTLWIFLPIAVVGVVVHELIHAASWAAFSRRPLSSMRVGFNRRSFTPFAHAKEPMPANAYRYGTLMPCLVLGVLPSAVAIAWGHGPLMAFGLFFTFVAGGDLVVLWLIRKVPAGKLVQDHPERAGCLVMDASTQPAKIMR